MDAHGSRWKELKLRKLEGRGTRKQVRCCGVFFFLPHRAAEHRIRESTNKPDYNF